MKTNEKVLILMASAIALIILSSFINFPSPGNKLKIEVLNQKAVKLNTNEEGQCKYVLNVTIINKGKQLDDAIFIVKMVKGGAVVEQDDFETGTMNELEVKSFQRNYTRSCDYIDEFNLSFSR